MKYGFILWALLTGNYLFAQVIPVGFIKPINTSIPTGGNPVTNNLLLYLDATRRASYDASGSIWSDISGVSPANSATLVSGPTFSVANNVGSFTFAASKYALTSTLISSLSAATFIAWVNPSTIQSNYTGIILSRNGYANATGNASGLVIVMENSINLVSYVWDGVPDTYNWRSLSLTVPINRWSMIAVSITSTGAAFYVVNSSGTIRATNSNAHSPVSGHQFYVGVDPFDISNRAFKGKIATSMVYASALTQTNIVDIYNAQKAAFGL
jgi:hypothetical protein